MAHKKQKSTFAPFSLQEPWVGPEGHGLWAKVSLALGSTVKKNAQDAAAIAQALQNKNMDAALSLIEMADPSVVHMREQSSQETLLHKACAASFEAGVAKLLSLGADPFAGRGRGPSASALGHTALTKAAQAGSAACVEAIAKALPGDDRARLFNRSDRWGATPALLAAQAGHAEALAAIAKAAPSSLWIRGEQGQTVAMAACKSGSVDCLAVAWRLEQDQLKPFSALDQRGCSALGCAVLSQSADCVQWFVSTAQKMLRSRERDRAARAAAFFSCGSNATHPLALAATGGVEIFELLAPLALRLASPSKRRELLKTCAEKAPPVSKVAAAIEKLRENLEAATEQATLDKADFLERLTQMRRQAGKTTPRLSAQPRPERLLLLARSAREKLAAQSHQSVAKLPRGPKSGA